MTLSSIAAAGAPPSEDPKPTKIEDAPKQFEALLIGQMLKSAREASADEDSTGATMLDVADQQFSKLIANNGGMGLARMIVNGLKQGEQNAHNQRSAKSD